MGKKVAKKVYTKCKCPYCHAQIRQEGSWYKKHIDMKHAAELVGISKAIDVADAAISLLESMDNLICKIMEGTKTLMGKLPDSLLNQINASICASRVVTIAGQHLTLYSYFISHKQRMEHAKYYSGQAMSDKDALNQAEAFSRLNKNIQELCAMASDLQAKLGMRQINVPALQQSNKIIDLTPEDIQVAEFLKTQSSQVLERVRRKVLSDG